VKNSSKPSAALPFLIGSDGRLYISSALIQSSTINSVITDRARAAS
jgi:hypothetical protein